VCFAPFLRAYKGAFAGTATGAQGAIGRTRDPVTSAFNSIVGNRYARRKVYKTMISIDKLIKEKLVSGHARKLFRIIPVIFALALFGAMSDLYAQQKDEIVRVHGIPISIKSAAKTDDKKDDKKKDDSPLSDREDPA
jgi:hypothetical protein